MTPAQIVRLRHSLKLTQQQLADRIGAQRHTVARWETGSNKPMGANLKALLELERAAPKRADEQKDYEQNLLEQIEEQRKEIRALREQVRRANLKVIQLGLEDLGKAMGMLSGVPQTAQRTYRKLAAKYHPDRNPQGAEFMTELNELWQEITKAEKTRGRQ